ncbi:hypothetical protein D3C73_1352620 [compost metagenome]
MSSSPISRSRFSTETVRLPKNPLRLISAPVKSAKGRAIGVKYGAMKKETAVVTTSEQAKPSQVRLGLAVGTILRLPK